MLQIQDNLAQVKNRIGFYAYMPLKDINNFVRGMVNAMEHSNAYTNMAAGNHYSFLAGTQMNIEQPQDNIQTKANLTWREKTNTSSKGAKDA
ncbi:hypothetical protein [Legionella sp.]|uniref:hypothetical protein n=1 Tax=Legionella sp. TaxID=459 RepID=UPI003D0C05EE